MSTTPSPTASHGPGVRWRTFAIRPPSRPGSCVVSLAPPSTCPAGRPASARAVRPSISTRGPLPARAPPTWRWRLLTDGPSCWRSLSFPTTTAGCSICDITVDCRFGRWRGSWRCRKALFDGSAWKPCGCSNRASSAATSVPPSGRCVPITSLLCRGARHQLSHTASRTVAAHLQYCRRCRERRDELGELVAGLGVDRRLADRSVDPLVTPAGVGGGPVAAGG